MPADGELKIPDETFRIRNAGPDPATAANPLRTNAGIRGTARRKLAAPRAVRPVEPYFSRGFSFGPRPPGRRAPAVEGCGRQTAGKRLATLSPPTATPQGSS